MMTLRVMLAFIQMQKHTNAFMPLKRLVLTESGNHPWLEQDYDGQIRLP